MPEHLRGSHHDLPPPCENCGDIDVLERPKRRCTYCTCGGWLTVQSFVVDDEGISDERSLSEECAWEE